MQHHRLFSDNSLNEEVLQAMREELALRDCPYCLGLLEEPDCLPTAFQSRSPNPEYIVRRICKMCSVLWELQMLSWVDDKGYNLTLDGYQFCYCRQRVYARRIDESSKRHSKLNNNPKMIPEGPRKFIAHRRHNNLPRIKYGTPEFEEAYKGYCGMGMHQDPAG